MVYEKYVYPYNRTSAKRDEALEQYQESYELNIKCTEAIEQSIEKGFDGNQGYRLSPELAREVIGEFGYDRVNHILANTLQQLKSDGRFSRENKEWAKKAYIPLDKVGPSDRRKDFVVNKSHPAVLDGFINLVRKEYQPTHVSEKSLLTDTAVSETSLQTDQTR